VYEIAMSLPVGTMILGVATALGIVAYNACRNNSAKAK
jgi:hypothetical protein